ncbi:MAG TPA: hypothetical protein GXZ87_01145 [Bacteroidales bacterium]|nr:hypothetical protein [Bacteroidales bacterium]
MKYGSRKIVDERKQLPSTIFRLPTTEKMITTDQLKDVLEREAALRRYL